MNNTMETLKRWIAIFALFLIWAGLLTIVIHDNKPQLLAKYKSLTSEPPMIISFDILLHNVPAGIQRGNFYYDTGRGFNPGEVVSFTYDQKINVSKHYVIKIPTAQRILRLRFDPLDGSGKISIRDLSITKYKEQNVQLDAKELDLAKNSSISEVSVNDSNT